MKFFQLDDDFIKFRKKTWPNAFKLALIFVSILWIVFIVDLITPFIYLNQFGIHPRSIHSVFGIFFTIFLHGDFSHLISNSLPIMLAITALYGNYPKTANKVFILAVLITGVLVWLFARDSNHIGASGLLYSLLTFIFVSGFLRKDIQSIGISFVIAFLYGSLIFGIIPTQKHISWESHLFGMVSGLILAWTYRKTDIPVFKIYEDYDGE